MNKKTVKAEIIRCGQDPVYFIRNYVKIQHPKRGLIPFDLYPYQEELIRAYQKNRFNVILKARQLGISEVTAAYATWMILFRRDKNILVMATKKDTSKNIIRKVDTAIKNLPSWLMLAKVKRNNVFDIELTTGSRIKAISTTREAGRSEAVSFLIIDEAAHIDNMEEIWTGILPTVQAGGSVSMLSTPKGVGNTFHKVYVQAEQGENDFFLTKLMWWLHPERVLNEEGLPDLEDDPLRPGFKTSSWFRKETMGMGPRDVAQELECNFNASGDNFISADYMEWIEKNTMFDPESYENWDRALHVWKKPEAGRQYFISADVARGDGKDNSAAHVWDISTMEQVAEYYGKVPPDDFANLVCRMGREYNGALLVVENNSIGLACLEHVKLAEYENVYYSSKGNFSPGKSVNTAFQMPSMNELVPGFTTSPRTRPLMLAKLEEYVRTRMIIIRSPRLMGELRKFVWHNGKAEAMKGYNDDLVMAAAIGCWIRDTFLGSSILNEELSKKMLDCTSYNRTENVDIPGATKNPEFIKKNERISLMKRNPYTMTMPNGQLIDIGWLISTK